ncbi:SHOCT domain-containing protein (plasmid) [Halorussus limi]|uniref:SHOCT domain-containing protein n=1 Tax=Halorussus limi TaxID=2938695 RepID=A0A8U0I088_9EURY|nr:SHOCT domain-containing protein [Halorussus limi]UPV76690.1 SHOCT domain-containing protein [Halorussus limi]
MSSQNQSDSLLLVVLAVLAIIVLLPVLMMAFSLPMMGMMGWWGGGGGGPGTGLSPLWGIGTMLFFFAILLGTGYILYRGFIGSQVLERDQALEELRTAYARGELSDEEFERRREQLRQDES